MDGMKQKIVSYLEEDYDYLRELRRDFHRFPEIGEKEYKTAARIKAELDKLGLPFHSVAGTGVVAYLDGRREEAVPLDSAGRPRCLALRADIDALPLTEGRESPYKSQNPGCMHACGHDVHMTSLIGTARILNRLRDSFSGRIILVFQPGEENGYGGKTMVEAGAVAGATRCFGFHIAPELMRGTMAVVPGSNNASVDWFRIRIRGTGSHVAYPHQGADALYMASQIVVAAQSLVTRMCNPTEGLLLSFGRAEAGTAYNVVADQATLEGTIRALNPVYRSLLIEKLTELVHHTAALYGGSAEMEWAENGAMLINTPEAVKEVRLVAKALLGEDKLVERKPALIGDDMSEFINAVSGCYAFIGTQNPERPETAYPLHHVLMDVDEEVFKVSVPVTAAYALAYMRGEI